MMAFDYVNGVKLNFTQNVFHPRTLPAGNQGIHVYGSKGAVDLLRSPAFFDVEQFPEATFQGAATGEGSLARFTLAGELTIRGVTRPHRMEARLEDRRHDPALGREAVEFSASGEMRRSEFGMTAEQAAISDTIRLQVRVRLLV